jgi:putative membrane protein
MKKLSSILMIALAACVFQACHSGAKDSTAAADSLNAVKDTTTSGMKGIAVDKDDAKFAVDAANGGMTEIALSKIAAAQSTNPKIRDFAKMMVTDHSKAGDELMAIAKKKNITMPDSVNADSKKAINEMTMKTGSPLNKAYVDKMVADHKGAVSLFEDASKNAKDPDLKAFATNTLPTIKSHLAAISAMQDAMK